MTPQTQFASDLRDLLYLSKITTVFAQWLRQSAICPSGLKNRCLNVEACLKALETSVLLHTTPENRRSLVADLTKDQIHDIANLLHLVADIDNVGQIVEAIKTVKTETVCTSSF